MPFRRRLVVFGYPLLEILTIVGLAQLIGWGWTLLILIAGIPIGFAVMSRAGRSAFSSMREASRAGRLPDGTAGTHALAFLAGALIAVPGLWTDLAGALLLLPPVRRRVSHRYGPRVTAFTSTAGGMRPPSFGTSDVIKGTVVNTENAQPNAPGHADGPAAAGPSGAVGSS
ncbi:unannotated protein [freshwater metagenome]|uniref:Unannotated protein n=1 Tax=freshwater metagenome TaxID=449393 RepID=A0A6J7JSR4_9ZZZZ